MRPIDEKLGNIRTKPEPECPECGEKMVLRIPRADQAWKAFWGCSNFPNCRGSLNIGLDGLPIEEEEWDELSYDDWYPGHPSNFGDR